MWMRRQCPRIRVSTPGTFDSTRIVTVTAPTPKKCGCGLAEVAQHLSYQLLGLRVYPFTVPSIPDLGPMHASTLVVWGWESVVSKAACLE